MEPPFEIPPMPEESQKVWDAYRARYEIWKRSRRPWLRRWARLWLKRILRELWST